MYRSLRDRLDDVPFNPPRITGRLGTEWRIEKLQAMFDYMDSDESKSQTNEGLRQVILQARERLAKELP